MDPRVPRPMLVAAMAALAMAVMALGYQVGARLATQEVHVDSALMRSRVGVIPAAQGTLRPTSGPEMVRHAAQDVAPAVNEEQTLEGEAFSPAVAQQQTDLSKVMGLLGLASMAAGLFLLKPKAMEAAQTSLVGHSSWTMAATAEMNPLYRCKTTAGDFVVELFMDRMPITASNWMDLAETGYYNGIHFHRVIDNFMIQFGCPFARDPRNPRSGTGGPNPNTPFKVGDKMLTRNGGGNIPDEFAARISNHAGTLSMANTGMPNSGGSQFFINTNSNDFLDWWRDDLSPSKHPVFGRIVEGMDVIMKISKSKTDRRDSPVTPIQMISITREA